MKLKLKLIASFTFSLLAIVTQVYGQNPALDKTQRRTSLPVASENAPVVMTMTELLELQRLEDLNPTPPPPLKKEPEVQLAKIQNPASPATASSRKSVLQTRTITATTQAIHSNFLASQLSESGYVPPDNNGAVGPTQVITVVNGRLKVFPKTSVTAAATTTTTGSGTTPLTNTFSLGLDVFFSSVEGTGASTSDPHIRYDRLSQRWFIICIDVKNSALYNNKLLIAASSGPIITNSSSFTFFGIAHNLIAPAGDDSTFCDYPTLGVDKNSLYIGGNIFSKTNAFVGCNMYVVNKTDLIKTTPVLTATAFRNSVTFTDSYTPQGVDNDDPTATEGYFISTSQSFYGKLIINRITYSGTTPLKSADINLTVSSTFDANKVPYQGAIPITDSLDAIDYRLFAAMAMKNKITGVTTLWTAHSFGVNASGVASITFDRHGCRWYEIGNLTGTPTVVQFGTVNDGTATNPKSYWISGIAGTGQGHAGMIMHSAGVANYPNIEVAGRYRTDPGGTLQTPVAATTAASNYNPTIDLPTHRWGDYAQMVVDPDDNMTLWGFAQYCNGTDSYGVRAVQLQAPAPPQTLATIFPAGACGTNVSLTINGTSVAGANQEFFDPGAGYNNRLKAVVTSPASITVNSMTFNSVSKITPSLSTSFKSAGTYTISVSNPDGQTTTGTFTLPDCICSPGTTAPVLSSKVFLQGPYSTATSGNSVAGLMNDNLRQLNLIPTSQPYTAANGFTQVGCGGTETINAAVLSVTGNNAIVDWIFLELRDSTNPATIISTRSALLQRDGDIVDVDGVSPVSFNVSNGNYFVGIKHRNHLAIRTSVVQSVSAATPLVLDFTNTGTPTYGSNAQKSANSTYFMWAGDANGDGKIIYAGSGSDVNFISQSVFQNPGNTGFSSSVPRSGYFKADLNMDGKVVYAGAGSDVNIISQSVFQNPSNTGFSSTIPLNAPF